jgi:hypothetical protein
LWVFIFGTLGSLSYWRSLGDRLRLGDWRRFRLRRLGDGLGLRRDGCCCFDCFDWLGSRGIRDRRRRSGATLARRFLELRLLARS